MYNIIEDVFDLEKNGKVCVWGRGVDYIEDMFKAEILNFNEEYKEFREIEIVESESS